jgi:hypothetical protein
MFYGFLFFNPFYLCYCAVVWLQFACTWMCCAYLSANKDIMATSLSSLLVFLLCGGRHGDLISQQQWGRSLCQNKRPSKKPLFTYLFHVLYKNGRQRCLPVERLYCKRTIQCLASSKILTPHPSQPGEYVLVLRYNDFNNLVMQTLWWLPKKCTYQLWTLKK